MFGSAHAPQGAFDSSIKAAKATLLVYYTFMQGDKAKCRSAIDAARVCFKEVLDEVGTGDCFLGIVDKSADQYTAADYTGVETAENSRRLADMFKTKMENFEYIYALM